MFFLMNTCFSKFEIRLMLLQDQAITINQLQAMFWKLHCNVFFLKISNNIGPTLQMLCKGLCWHRQSSMGLFIVLHVEYHLLDNLIILILIFCQIDVPYFVNSTLPKG
jgi:hypothetical protein